MGAPKLKQVSQFIPEGLEKQKVKVQEVKFPGTSEGSGNLLLRRGEVGSKEEIL